MRNAKLVAMICIVSNLAGMADALTSDVRQALDNYTNSVRRTLMRVETIRNVGLANTHGESYRNLCRAVSNDVNATFRRLPEITTNAAERLVLMSTAWMGDEDLYLNAYEALADLAISNQVAKSELEWFGLPERSDLSNCIRCRYREPRITNLVYKISQATGDTNLYFSIVSGASYTNYLEEAAAGLW